MKTATLDSESMYDRVRHVVSPPEWAIYWPQIQRIQQLKSERNAVVLAHTYQRPEIFYTIADVTGDSLQLAREAEHVEADIIVMCGVIFMAETTKIMNPSRTVLIPDLRAGCSLANSITGADVRALRARYPGVPVVSYVNTNADVKAETDICCTSSNAVQVVNSLDSDRIIFLPDQYLGHWVSTQTDKEIILWNGACEVHERFSGRDIRDLKMAHPGLSILVHPECPPDVIAEADFVGSTTNMMNRVAQGDLKQVALITECTMADNVVAVQPDIEVIRPCNLCPHMGRINLGNVITALENRQNEITIPVDIMDRARGSITRMLDVKLPERA